MSFDTNRVCSQHWTGYCIWMKLKHWEQKGYCFNIKGPVACWFQISPFYEKLDWITQKPKGTKRMILCFNCCLCCCRCWYNFRMWGHFQMMNCIKKQTGVLFRASLLISLPLYHAANSAFPIFHSSKKACGFILVRDSFLISYAEQNSCHKSYKSTKSLNFFTYTVSATFNCQAENIIKSIDPVPK